MLVKDEVRIEGRVDDRFRRLKDAFRANFHERGDIGAGVAVYLDGREVVNLWGGEAAPGRAWTADTLIPTLSIGKAISGLAVQLAWERGLFDLQGRMSDLWPAFAAGGKETVTVHQVLTHSAGLPWFPDYEKLVSFDDLDSFARTEEIYAALAAAPPVWEPGTKAGSHSITIGWLHAAIVRAVTGQSIRDFTAEHIAAPLGTELWFGLDDAQERRAATAVADAVQDTPEVRKKVNPDTWPGRTLFLGWNTPPGTALEQAVNHPGFRRAEVPSANMFSTAEALAKVFGALANGGVCGGARLATPESTAVFSAERHNGPDAVFPTVVRHSYGYILPVRGQCEFGPSLETFGHPARSGAIAFADPSARLGFAYLPSKQKTGYATDPRAAALIEATYDSLAD